MQLRHYQQEAVQAVYRHLRERDDNPVVVIPPAGGKTPILATICKDAVVRWEGRALVLTHVKELLEQAVDKLRRVCPELPVGVYSAGLNRRDTQERVIVAGIQSVYKRAAELEAFDLIIVDEVHLVPPDGDGMYRQFLAEARLVNPRVRLIGLTATPFRLDSGPICGPDRLLSAVCYEIGVRQLIRDGYLCPLVSKAGKAKADTRSLHVRGGEFVTDEVERLMDQASLVASACAEIVAQTRDRRAVLIFAAGVKHGRHVARVLSQQHGQECGFISGETPASERDEVIRRFRGESVSDLLGERPPLKFLVNVNVLTTGFDAPRTDCVVLLRPTMSPGLFCQQAGRGFRLYPGKQDCLVLDYGENVLRHGPVDQLRVAKRDGAGSGEAPAKECPQCRALIATGYACCPDCGHAFPPPERQAHAAQASRAGILSGQVTLTRYAVRDTRHSLHVKRGADESAPRSLRVEYCVGWQEHKSEWVCFEHQGFARQKAVAWWRRRSPDPVPDTAERAVELAEAGALAPTLAITVRAVAGEPFERIVDWELGEMPEPVEAGAWESDDVPF
jgi:DNA repair protein RadD